MMHLICDWAGFYCFWGLRVFRLCLRPVEKNRNKSRSPRPKLVTHTHRTFLWTILKRKMKNSTWRICLNTCTPFLSPSFSFFFFARVAQLHAGEVNGCLSARREPPLICTECRSSTTAHTHTWRAARAFEGECRTSISKPECKWTQHLHVVTAKCKNKHLRLQNSRAFSSQLNQDTGTIAQSPVSAKYATDSCSNNFAFIWHNQKGKQIQTEVPTWQASSKHCDICMLIGHSKGKSWGSGFRGLSTGVFKSEVTAQKWWVQGRLEDRIVQRAHLIHCFLTLK